MEFINICISVLFICVVAVVVFFWLLTRFSELHMGVYHHHLTANLSFLISVMYCIAVVLWFSYLQVFRSISQ
ncbi:hypothetical protein BJV74DRAFT_122356 [Russula compacta]|nr:hypothetical protein BJV74DRAFT_122356 [Russula compacta]